MYVDSRFPLSFVRTLIPITYQEFGYVHAVLDFIFIFIKSKFIFIKKINEEAEIQYTLLTCMVRVIIAGIVLCQSLVLTN